MIHDFHPWAFKIKGNIDILKIFPSYDLRARWPYGNISAADAVNPGSIPSPASVLCRAEDSPQWLHTINPPPWFGGHVKPSVPSQHSPRVALGTLNPKQPNVHFSKKFLCIQGLYALRESWKTGEGQGKRQFSSRNLEIFNFDLENLRSRIYMCKMTSDIARWYLLVIAPYDYF